MIRSTVMTLSTNNTKTSPNVFIQTPHHKFIHYNLIRTGTSVLLNYDPMGSIVIAFKY